MQKLLGDKLYVFDLTPYEITQQTADASVIYVQNECIDGYKELNVSLADKIEGFNQFVLCISDPWKEGVEPVPCYTLTISGNNIHDNIDVYFDNVQQPVNMTYENVEADTVIKIVPKQDVARYELIEGATWDSEAQAWLATMPDEDLTIQINYTPVYTLYISGNYSEYTVKVNDGQPEGPSGRIDNLESGDVVIFTPTYDHTYYNVSQNLFWNQDISAWEITMGDEDTSVSLEFTAHSINIVAQTPGAESNISIDKVIASPGETVTITFEENHDGANTFIYTNPEVELTFIDPVATFEMPAYDVNVLVQFTGVTNVYNVEDASNEVILYKGSEPSGSSAVVKAPDEMWVDGSYETVSPTWRFDEEGEHIVQYSFEDNANTVETNFESAPITETYVGKFINNISSALWGYMGGSLDTPQTYIEPSPPNIDGGIQISSAPTGYIFVPEESVNDYKSQWHEIASNIYPIGTDPDAI